MKSLEDLQEVIKSLTQTKTVCSNAHVVQIILDSFPAVKGKRKTISFTKVIEHVKLDFPASRISVPHSIQKARQIYDTYKRLTKHVDRNWDKIYDFLRTRLILPEEDSTCFNSDHLLARENSPPPQNSSSNGCIAKVSTPVKTRRDCENCPSAKKSNAFLNFALRNEKRKAFHIKLAAASIKKDYKVRETRQQLKRQSDQIASLRKKLAHQSIEIAQLRKRKNLQVSACERLKKEKTHLSGQNSKLASENLTLANKVKLLQAENKGLRKEMREYEISLNHLQCESECQQRDHTDDTFHTMEGKRYSPLVRRCVYQQLLCDVPITNCGWLLRSFIGTLLQKNVDRVPCAATCSQMAYELGVLSSLQLSEFMMSQKSLCLSWDATSLEGAHINEVHVTANKVVCLVLDIRHLAGGKTADYVSHIVSALTEAAATYARLKKLRQEDVYSRIKSAISATLTDRAAVNACVTRQLRDEMESELLQLNCNVHPLDSMARDVRRKLDGLDKKHGISGCCFGSDGTATNLINAVSVLRFKDGTGDPLGFKNLLRQKGVPMGTVVRFVGNRLHIQFHSAGILVTYHDMLLTFTEEQCTGGGFLRTNIMKDLKNDKIMAQVWALGVVGKILSGPWMTRFYSSEMSNLEMGPLIQQCMSKLREWIANPSLLLQPSEDAFGTSLQPQQDKVLSALMSYEADEFLQVESLKVVLEASLCVLERQLKEFIFGDYAQPTQEMKERASGAPTHNMTSERNLGCYDRLYRRAPNATVGFLTGKVKCKMNKTLEWLDAKNEQERSEMIQFVVNEAKEERVRKFVEQKALNVEIAGRRQEVAEQRRKSKLCSVIRQINKAVKTGDTSGLTCAASLKDRLQLYMNDSNSVVGMLVIHTVDTVDWYARVLGSLPSQKKLELSYWSMNEPESSSTDFTITVSQFYADAILGNVAFL